jgi:hypothetical protein
MQLLKQGRLQQELGVICNLLVEGSSAKPLEQRMEVRIQLHQR